MAETSPPVSGLGVLHGNAQEWGHACYAWPVTNGQTGRRAFVINQSGDLLQSDNAVQQYSGTAVTHLIIDALGR